MSYTILRSPVATSHYIVTIAIGPTYLSAWTTNAKPAWLDYCRKYDIGLIVITGSLCPTDSPVWKKPTWQKLLIPQIFTENSIEASLVCYLDSDILISPLAQNVFTNVDPFKVNLVSKRSNLPYNYDLTLRRIAHLRHTRYSSDYPLDSALFISLTDLYEYHQLPPQPDEACMGVFIFSPYHYGDIFMDIFNAYNQDVKSITNGGDQTHLNYEFQHRDLVSWLPYTFQTLWVYEIANYFPFLYDSQYSLNHELIKSCVESSLIRSSFLHFAGSWHESSMWNCQPFMTSSSQADISDYCNYLLRPLSGQPVGFKKP